MLTKQDLEQIREIVQNGVKTGVKNELEPVKKDMVHIKTELNSIKKDVKATKEDIVHIRKDTKTIVNFFDKEYLELRKRIERIEELLKLPPTN